MAHMNLGMLYRQENKNADEIRQLQLAWDQERELTKSQSMSFEVPFYISYLEGELGIAHARAGHREKAIDHLKAAICTAEALVVTYPAGKKYADLLANFQEALAYAEKDSSSDKY
jgi:tetratricopeptide (TPR) repeat protein